MGRAVAYNALSAPLQNFRERVSPGAFTKSLANTKQNVIADFNHQENAIPLGTTKAGTLQLTDKPDGLYFRCLLDANNSEHRNLWSSVKRGDLSEMSWAFNVDGTDGEDWDSAQDEEGRSYNRRTIKRAILHGISVVCHPAYPGVTTVDARSAAHASIPLNEKAVLLARLSRQRSEIERDLRMNPIVATALRNHCSVTALEDAELRLKAAEQAKELMFDEDED
jgi:hypothetical protein